MEVSMCSERFCEGVPGHDGQHYGFDLSGTLRRWNGPRLFTDAGKPVPMPTGEVTR